MTMEGFSVIRVELERAAISFKAMVTTAMVERDEEVQRAIEQALSPEGVTRFVQREVERAVESVIREEVERYYRSGAGRFIVRELVYRQLEPKP